MVKSSFTGIEIKPGTGIMFVKKDGSVLWFANRKEEKNMIKLGRVARKTKWVTKRKP